MNKDQRVVVEVQNSPVDTYYVVYEAVKNRLYRTPAPRPYINNTPEEPVDYGKLPVDVLEPFRKALMHPRTWMFLLDNRRLYEMYALNYYDGQGPRPRWGDVVGEQSMAVPPNEIWLT